MSKIPRSIFRAYDIRGIVNQDLTLENVKLITYAIGTMAIQKNIKYIALGRDGRLSSEMFSKIIIENLLNLGINIIDVGMVTTPMLYFTSLMKTKGSGVMVTGSHNPPQYNGLKIILSSETLSEEKIFQLFNIIENNEFVAITDKIDKGCYQQIDISPNYLEYIKNNVILSRKMKIIIDTGNGVGGKYAGKLFRLLGCEVKELFSEVDGNFPNHYPDTSNPENLQFLIDELHDSDFELGIALDGDADRLVVVNSDGNIIWPDRLLMLFAKDILLKTKRNNIITKSNIIFDIKSTGLLFNWIKKHGGNPIISRTGHSFIKSEMKKYNAILAGEMSGHIFFNDKWFGFDDGLYAATRLLEILSRSAIVSRILNDIPHCISTPEINIPIQEENKNNVITMIRQEAKFPNAINIINIDGIRVEYSYGFGLIRASNTTPCLVLRFEAINQEFLIKIQQEFKNILKLVDIDFNI